MANYTYTNAIPGAVVTVGGGAVGAQGSSGTYSISVGANGTTGYSIWAAGAGGSAGVSGPVGSTTSFYSHQLPKYAVQLNAAAGVPALTIDHNGEAEWHGKPSAAADAFIRCLTVKLEDHTNISKTVRRRYYYQACKNLLKKAESMTHEEFIDFLREHVYTREGKVILDALKDE